MNKTIAVVRFIDGYSTTKYDFFNDVEDLEKDDLVVVDTANGYSLAKVVEFKETSTKANKWIVQKVDTAAHKARLEKQAAIKALRHKMEQRRKQIQDVQVYALLAQTDPEMAEMLKQFLTLEGTPNVVN